MSIQKKSLISTLQSTKKANIAKETVTPEGTTKAAGLKASPISKLSAKYKLVQKAAGKQVTAQKAAGKQMVLAQKAVSKQVTAQKAASKR
jgi:hypothetical protein